MSKHKLLLTGSIIGIFIMVLALLCTLPVDPKDPSNTKVNIILRNTYKTDINFLEDSAGNLIRIGVALNLPENIDSVNLKIIHGSSIVFDTMFKDIQPTSDTLWKDIVFYTEGTRTISLTPYSSLVLSSPSATIKIIGKQFPVNNAPTLTVTGNRVIKPNETCSLAIQTSDSDSDQELTVFVANNPDGSQLLKNNTQFVWTPPAAFIGNDTVTFTVIDNGKPPLSVKSDVIITVTATPHPPVIKVSGDLTLAPLETCSLKVSVSDEDAGQMLEIAMSGQPNEAQLVDDSIFVWTVPADFVGEKTVTFTVTDNGEPPLSSSVQATIIVSAATVNSAPKWDTKILPVPLEDTARYEKNLTEICRDVDGDKITFTLISGTPVGDTIIEATYSFVAQPALVGAYNVKIIAADPKGTVDTLTIDLTVTSSSAVDVTQPSITLVTPPRDSFEVSTPAYLIDVISSDVSGIASVTATFGGTMLPMQPAAGHYTVTMGGLKAGEYNKIDLIATDASAAGNKKTKTVYIKFNQGFSIRYDGNGSTGGSVPVDTVSYTTGATVTVRVNSGNLVKTGSTFAGWNTAADGGGTSYAPGATFAMGGANDTLFAKWASKKSYVLTINATNGSVTRVPDLPAYDSGTVVTLTPVPEANYHFSGWSGALTGFASPATVIMDGAKTVTAVFEMNRANSFALTVLATNGTVAKTPEQPQYDSGSTVSLTATAAPGYQFSGWAGALTGSTNPASITMNGAKTVTANFTAIPVALTLTNDGHGTTTPPSPASGSYNVPITISATPATGYSFSNWTVTTGGTNATFGSSTTASTTVTLTGDATIRANFTANPLTLTMSNDGHGTTTPTTTATVSYDVAYSISATANTGYSFSSWTVTNGTATFANSNAASTTVSLTTNATIRANFTANPVTLTLTNDGHGTTTPTSSASGSYNEPIAISATPASGYSFSNWTVTTGGTNATFGSTTTANTTVTLTGNATIRANFTALTYSVTYDRNNGTGTVPTDNNQYTNGNTVTIKSNTGGLVYGSSSFVGWSTINGTTYACGQQITISDNLALYAKYSATEVMDNDGNLYTSVLLANKRWLVQNLKTTKYRNGSSITYASDSASWVNRSTGTYCWQEYNISNKVYGALYNWAAVQAGQVAPAGWRIPTETEWANLFDFYNRDGCAYITEGTTYWYSEHSQCGSQTNTSGFSAMGNGYMPSSGIPWDFRSVANWWVSGGHCALIMYGLGWALDEDLDYNEYGNDPNIGVGIRCVQE